MTSNLLAAVFCTLLAVLKAVVQVRLQLRNGKATLGSRLVSGAGDGGVRWIPLFCKSRASE